MNRHTRSRLNRVLLTCGLAAAMAVPVVGAEIDEAAADVHVRVKSPRVHVRAPRVRVRAQGIQAPRVRVRVRRHRHHVTHRPRHRLHISGGVYVGGSVSVGRTYAAPPPPPPAYDCDVPAYYYGSPPPPQPVVVAPAPVYEPMGPRLGIGLFAGGTKTELGESDDVGLIARYRLTRGLALEGELAKTEAHEGQGEETRRMGGALIWDLSSRSRLSPHLLGGMGRWDDGNYAELGAGLTWRMTPRFHVAFDLRAGLHGTESESAPVARGGEVIPPPDEDEPQEYTRGRLSALLYF